MTIPHASFFWKQLGLGDDRTTNDADQRNLVKAHLIDTIQEWARCWRINDPDFIFYFATAVLIVGQPMATGTRAVSPPWAALTSDEHSSRRSLYQKESHSPVSGWKKVAEEYLRLAESQLLPRELVEKCGPPAGFEFYVGRGHEEYIKRQIAKTEFLYSERNSTLAALPVAYKKQIAKWVSEIAEDYCQRVDAVLKQRGAQSKRVEPTFARDIEWTVERRILNWDWERIVRGSETKFIVWEKESVASPPQF